ncbi:hypothetical protein [Methylocapsa acidiphila]|uniref:hypothetical protein n=1 Tax=Methylocapsa acidiphila TaxID=133552 RepID=UPI0012EC87E0|nr:hypothetical protein [Methylocapsa acidiphila]
MLFLSVCSVGAAQSMPLSSNHIENKTYPRPTKNTGIQQLPAESGQHPTSSNSTDGHGNAGKGSNNTFDKVSPDLIVAWFTGMLVVVGAAQVCLFFWQLRLIRESLADAKESADAAAEAAKAATEQAIIAKRTFEDRERPYIFVFGVKYIQRSGDPFSGGFIVEYNIANYGSTPAIIDEAYIGVVRSQDMPPALPSPIYDGHSLLSSPIFPSGERRDNLFMHVPDGIIVGDGGGEIVAFNNNGSSENYPIPIFNDPDMPIFFRVLIKYRGTFSSGHETAALWIYDHAFNTFTQTREKLYNYIR